MAQANFTLGADVREFVRSLSQARTSLRELNGQMEDVRAEARQAGVALTALAGLGTLAFRNALNTFADFEQTMRNVIIVVDETEEVLREMTQAAIEVGQTTQVTATQAANALFEIALAGFTAQESMESLQATVSLSIAAQQSIKSTALLVTSTIRAFRLEASEAARVADIFTNAITQSPASLEKLAASFRYAGPVARDYGATLEETVASLELLYLTGLRGEQAGTALRNTFVRLVNPTTQARKIIEELGLTVQDVNPRIVGLHDALLTLREAGIAASDATQIFGVRAINAYITLSNAGKEGLEGMIEGLKQVGRAEEVAQRQLDTFRGSVTLFQSALETARITIGGFIAEALRPFVDVATAITRAFIDLPEPIQRIVTAVSIAATAVTGFLGALLLTIPAMQTFGTRWDAASKMLRGSLSTFASVGQALLNLVASLGATVASMLGFQVQADRITLSGLIAQLRAFSAAQFGASTASGVLQVALVRLGAAFRAFFVALTSTPLGPIIVGLTALAAAFEAFRRDLGGIRSSLSGVLSSLAELGGAIAELAGTLIGALSPAVEAIIDSFGALLSLIGTVLEPALIGAGLVFSELAFGIRILGASLQFVNDVLNENGGAWGRYVERLNEARQTANDTAQSLLGVGRESADGISEATEETAAWRQEFDRLKETLTGQELVDALTDLLFRVQGNASAVGLINEELDRTYQAISVAAAEMQVLQDEADQAADTFSRKLEDVSISFIEEDELRKLEEARVRFERLREEIDETAAKNVQFEPFAESLIAETVELEAAEVERIQREASEARQREAERAYNTLENLARQREGDITSIRAALAETELKRLQIQKEQEVRETERAYEEMEEAALEDAQRIAEIQEEKNAVLVQLEAQHQRNLSEIDVAFDEKADRFRARFEQLIRDAQGDSDRLAEIEERRTQQFQEIAEEREAALAREAEAYAENKDQIISNYGDLEGELEENARRQEEIAEQRTQNLQLIEQQHLEEVSRIYDDINQALIDRQDAVQRRLLELSGNKVRLAEFDLDQEKQAIDSFYDDLLNSADLNADQRVEIERARMRETLAAEREHNQEMKQINEDFYESLSDLRRQDRQERVQETGSPFQQAFAELRDEMRESAETFSELREEAGDDVIKLGAVFATELQNQIHIFRQFVRRMRELNQQYRDTIQEGHTRVREIQSETSGDLVAREELEHERRLAEKEAFIDELNDLVSWWNVTRRIEIHRLGNRLEEAEMERHHERMLSIEREFQEAINDLSSGLIERDSQLVNSRRLQIDREAQEQVEAAVNAARELLENEQITQDQIAEIRENTNLELDSIERERVQRQEELQQELRDSVESNELDLAALRARRSGDELEQLEVRLAQERERWEEHYANLLELARGNIDEEERIKAQRDEHLAEFDLTADEELERRRQELALESMKRIQDIYLEGREILTDILVAGTEDAFEQERLQHELQTEQIRAEYENRIEAARIRGEDTLELQRNMNLALRRNEQRHQQTMAQMAEDFYEDLEDRRRQAASERIQETGTDLQIEEADYEERKRAMEEFYADRLAEIGRNEELRNATLRAFQNERTQLEADHNRRMLEIQRDRVHALIDLSNQLAREAADITIDPLDDEQTQNVINMESITRTFDELERAYRDNAEQLEFVVKMRNQAIENEENRHSQALRDIHRSLLSDLRDFRTQMLQDQVEIGVATEADVLEAQLGNQLAAIQEFEDNKVAIARATGQTVEDIENLAAEARLAAVQRMNQEIQDLEEETSEERLNLQRDTARQLAEVYGDERSLAVIDYQAELDRINDLYDSWIERAQRTGGDIEGIEAERQARLRAEKLRHEQELTAIEEEEAEKRQRLQDMIYDRRQQILDLRLGLSGTDADQERADLQRALRESERAWTEIRETAEENNEGITQHLSDEAEERRLIEETYRDNVQQIYDDLADSVAGIISRTERIEVGLGLLPEPEAIRNQADRDIEELREFFEQAREEVLSDDTITPEERTERLLGLDEASARAEEAVLLDSQQRILDLKEEFDEALIDADLDTRRRLAEAEGDERLVAGIDLESEKERINRHYDDLVDLAKRRGDSEEEVNDRRQAALEAAEAEHQENLTRIAEEEADRRQAIQDALLEQQDQMVDLQQRMAGTDISRAYVDLERDLRELGRTWDDIREQIEEDNGDITGLDEQEAQDEIRIREAHAERVKEIYEDLADSVDDVIARTERLELDLGLLTEPEAIKNDADRQIATLTQFFDDARALVESDENLTPRERTELLLGLDEDEARAQEAILLDSQRRILDLGRDFDQALLDADLESRRKRAELADDTTLIASLDFEEERRRIDEFYDAWVEDAERNGDDINAVEERRRQAHLDAEAEHQKALTDLVEEETENRLALFRLLQDQQDQITDLQLNLTGTDISRAYVDLDRALRDVDESLRDIRESEAATTEDITQAEENAAEQRRLIWDNHRQEIEDIYQNLTDSIESEIRGITDIEVDLGLITSAEAEERRLNERLDQLRQLFADARELVESDPNLDAAQKATTIIGFDEDQARIEEALRADSNQRTIEQIKSFNDSLRDARVDTQQRLAELEDDQLKLASLTHQERVRQTNETYQELLDDAIRHGEDQRAVHQAWNEALAADERERQNYLKEIRRDALDEQLSDLSDGLDEMTVVQIRSLEEQVRAWEDAFGGDSEALSSLQEFRNALSDQLEGIRDDVFGRVSFSIDLATVSAEPIPDDTIQGLRSYRDELISAADAALRAGGSQEDYVAAIQEARDVHEQVIAAEEQNQDLIDKKIELLGDERDLTNEVTQARRSELEASRDILIGRRLESFSILDRINLSGRILDTYDSELEAAQNYADEIASQGGTWDEQVRSRLGVIDASRQMASALEQEIDRLRGLSEELQDSLSSSANAALDFIDAAERIAGGVDFRTEANRQEIITQQYERQLEIVKDQNASIEERAAALAEIERLVDAGDIDISFSDANSIRRAAREVGDEAVEAARESESEIQQLDAAVVKLEETLRQALDALSETFGEFTALADRGTGFDGEEESEGTNAFTESLSNMLDAVEGNLESLREMDSLLRGFGEASSSASDALDGIEGFDNLLEDINELRDAVSEEIDFSPAFEQLQEESDEAGAVAGEGLINAFAEGVEDNKEVLLEAIRGVLEEARGLLPSSDAKWGPLSDLTHSGRMLLRTVAEGARKEAPNFEAVMQRHLEGAKPKPTEASGGRVNPIPLFDPRALGDVTINVDGTSNSAPGPIALNARQLVRQAEREIRIKNSGKN